MHESRHIPKGGGDLRMHRVEKIKDKSSTGVVIVGKTACRLRVCCTPCDAPSSSADRLRPWSSGGHKMWTPDLHRSRRESRWSSLRHRRSRRTSNVPGPPLFTSFRKIKTVSTFASTCRDPVSRRTAVLVDDKVSPATTRQRSTWAYYGRCSLVERAILNSARCRGQMIAGARRVSRFLSMAVQRPCRPVSIVTRIGPVASQAVCDRFC
jgi:hypothetical protein